MAHRKYITSGSVGIDELLFHKTDGLIPVIVQERRNQKVLMMAYANRDALQRTLASGYAHYYSRSRSEIWKKGEQSGNLQRVSVVLADCDTDAILYIVDQQGSGACHTGEYSCFYRQLREEN